MGATQSADFVFTPKVWQDHVDAFFRRKLVWGAFATQDNTLTAAPGETINFPFYKKIGPAQEPLEDEGLSVESLSDDAFSATVKEIGRAVGIKMKALRTSAVRRERNFAEIQSQIGRVMAEKVDEDLVTEVNLASNHVVSLVGGDAAPMNIVRLMQAKIRGFGDRSDEAEVAFMHSAHWEDLLTDSTAGFLKADANDPLLGLRGFQGRLGGMAIVVTDTVPRLADVNSKQVFRSFIMKPNAYGFITAEAPEMERDKDILHREWVFAGTQWYAVKGFHAKVATDDLRITALDIQTQLPA